ncbi:MAG: hypothetical protein Q8R04_03830 [Nanoarchaeota archaeon]|nr:hypothetical protein [Nanoarchaeota archaeon]
MERFARLSRYLPGNALDIAYNIMHTPDGSFRESVFPGQVGFLEKLCDQAEERKLSGFSRFYFGTAIDRLVNKGLYGVAKQGGVTLKQIVEFRKRYFDEKTGEIDSAIKQAVLESGQKHGKRVGDFERYGDRIGRRRSPQAQERIREQYLKSFKMFELYLAHAPETKEPVGQVTQQLVTNS